MLIKLRIIVVEIVPLLEVIILNQVGTLTLEQQIISQVILIVYPYRSDIMEKIMFKLLMVQVCIFLMLVILKFLV